MTPARSAISASLVAILMAGCSNGGGSFDSGVDDSKPFDSITTEEAMTACLNLEAYVRRNIPEDRDLELNCTIMALQSTATPDDCRAAVQTCLAGTPEPLLGFDLDCTTAGPATDCSAPVGDVEQCITADLGQLFDRLDQVDCAIAGDVEALTALQMDSPTPVQCTELASVCPDLADGFTN